MKHGCFILCLMLLLVPMGCKRREPSVQTGFYMDTLCRFTAYGDEADALLPLCHQKMAELDASLDHRQETSTLYTLNHSNGAWTTLDPDAYAVLALACELAEETGGAFDPTIGAVLSAWDDFSGKVVPADAECETAASLVSYRSLELDETSRSARLAAGQSVAVGAIAKGYAADALAVLYRDHGCTGTIDLGGNIVTVGTKPGGTAFLIGVQDPFHGSSLLTTVSLTDRCAVTSGAYQRNFTLDGVTYHHIFDPTTGKPAKSDLASVTVFADNAARADALSTALFVLGSDRGGALARTLSGVYVLFVLQDGSVTEVSA